MLRHDAVRAIEVELGLLDRLQAQAAAVQVEPHFTEDPLLVATGVFRALGFADHVIGVAVHGQPLVKRRKLLVTVKRPQVQEAIPETNLEHPISIVHVEHVGVQYIGPAEQDTG